MDVHTTEAPVDGTASHCESDAAWGEGRLIKRTISICPQCLERIDAKVRTRQRQVWMDKHCPRHGRFSALLSSNIDHYYETASPVPGTGSCCGSSCAQPSGNSTQTGIDRPWTNHSCTILIEITERCNLSCPTCFAGSSPQNANMMSVQEFTRQVDQLAAGGKQGADLIQLSGGEPTIHPDFFTMIEILFEKGFNKVCVNSNGIKLAQRAFVERLAGCLENFPNGELFIYLQFDGFEDRTHAELRGRADLLSSKQKALQLCHQAGLNVHPVMTLTRGINDHEVGDFVRLALEHPFIKNVVIQPAMYSGRYDNPRRVDRLTLADTIDLICEQFGVFSPQDFTPIPCSDPNCLGMAVALRTRDGLLPISRYFPAFKSWGSEESAALIDRLTDTINGPEAITEAFRWVLSGDQLSELPDDDVDRLLDAVVRLRDSGLDQDKTSLWDEMLTVTIKPFMDAWTYDQDRIDQCCVHILDRAGNPVSFCEYNAVNRPRSMGSARPTGRGRIGVIKVNNP